MAVCIQSEGYDDDGHFGYGAMNGNHVSYTGGFLEGSEGNPQCPSTVIGNVHGNWSSSQQLDLSSLGGFWTAPCNQQDFNSSGGGGGGEHFVDGRRPQQPGFCGGGGQAVGGPHGQTGGEAEWRGQHLGRGSFGGCGGTVARPKRRFCTSFPDVSLCRRGSACSFAHSREEICAHLLETSEEEQDPAAMTDEFFMYKYKTRWCPVGVQHEWHTCVYAHNYQDARRPVNIGYGARLCPYWSKKDTGAEYSQRCPLGLRCPYAHGAKEQLYHPYYFKTVVCRDLKGKAMQQACPRQMLCAFFHSKAEKRAAPADDVDYSQPLRNESLPMEWVTDFLAPPFLGQAGAGEDVRPRFDSNGQMPHDGAIAPYSQQQTQQMPAAGAGGNNPQGQFVQMQATGPGNQPFVFLLPFGGAMPSSPGAGGGGQGGMSPDMLQQAMQSPQAGGMQVMQPQQANGMQGMAAQWVFVPMDGNGNPTL